MKRKKNLSYSIITMLVLFAAIVVLWLLFSEFNDNGTPIEVSTIPVQFTAVTTDNTFCFFANSKSSDAKTYIPKNKIVGVIGKNHTSEWALIRWEDFADCWVLVKFLDLQDKSVSYLQVIDTSSPPELPTEDPTEEPTKDPTEENTQVPTEEPTENPIEGFTQNPAFEVRVKVETIECACGGKSGKAKIILSMNGGKEPYNVNGQTPVKGNTISFETILGIKIRIKVISSDGQVWEDDVDVPYCSIPDDQCKDTQKPAGKTQKPTGKTQPPDSCTEKEVQVCEDVTKTIDVCVKRPPGNPGNCLEWEKQEKIETVCHNKSVCE